MKPGRNDPCLCGSGEKYKKCCGKTESSLPVQSRQYQNTSAQSNSAKDAAPAQNECNRLIELYNTGHHAELENRTRLLLEQYPDSGFIWKMLSASLLAQSKDALLALQKAAKFFSDDAVTHYNLGNNLKKLGRLDEAEASYRRVLQIKPDYVKAYNNLGNTLNELERLDEAEAICRQALLIEPDSAEAHSNLGNTLLDMGRLDEAEASCRRALQIKPDFAEAHINLGNTLINIGRLDEAEACFRRALQIKPDYVAARLSLASVGKVKAGDENLAALETAEEAVRNGITPLSDKDVVSLQFALGKSYDDLGDHEKAFPHFLEGCRLKRATFDHHDPDQAARLFTDIMRNFDAATLDRLRGGGDPSRLPIFILGMPRSGTTLTEQIIASHPEVHGAGELPDLMWITWRNIDGAAFPDNLRLLDQARLTTWGAEYVAGLQRRAPSALRITDKMPGNFLAVGLIHLMLPNAKIIHVKRNPVDTCLSCFTTMFKHGHEHTYDLAELGRYYVGYARLMEHWRKLLPKGAFFDVQYEDIVADQEAQSRRIIEYCGLEWNDACLDFHRNKRPVSTASVTQVRQPMYKSSVQRWRHYEKFLGPLLDALGELIPYSAIS